MTQKIYRKIIKLVLEAAEIARTIGIHNILQPGLIKEMIIADHLGHTVISEKRNADAHSPDDPTILYEYLSCKEGGRGQLDRMYKSPAEKRANSLDRIKRNEKVYLAVFFANEQTKVKTIYELDPNVVIQETERQLDASINRISHVGFSESWARENGQTVYDASSSG